MLFGEALASPSLRHCRELQEKKSWKSSRWHLITIRSKMTE